MEKVFKYIVYKTTNTINKKIYIGVHKVINTHIEDGYIGDGIYANRPSSYKNPTTIFQRAVKKYGPSNFVKEIIKIFDNIDDALDLERWLVYPAFIHLNSNYNMVTGGHVEDPTNSIPVYVYDEYGKYVCKFKSQQQASLYIYGTIYRSPSIIYAINHDSWCKKYKVLNHYEDHVESYSLYKDRLSRKQIDIFSSHNGLESNFANLCQIDQYDLDGNYIRSYKSINEAKRCGFTNIQAVIEGRRNTCKGYIFKRHEDYDIV